jgi:hypothetical protein
MAGAGGTQTPPHTFCPLMQPLPASAPPDPRPPALTPPWPPLLDPRPPEPPSPPVASLPSADASVLVSPPELCALPPDAEPAEPPLPPTRPPDPGWDPESGGDVSVRASEVSRLPDAFPSSRLSPVAQAARTNDAIHVTSRTRRIHSPKPNRSDKRSLGRPGQQPRRALTLPARATSQIYERLPRRRDAFFAGAAASASSAAGLPRAARFAGAAPLSPPPVSYLNDTFTLAR